MLNPHNIPVYLWENGNASLSSLEDFQRFPLKTYYLQRNYNGQNEPKYHLVNEHFDYTTVKETRAVLPKAPAVRVVYKSMPGNGTPSVSFDYSIPESGDARIEILDNRGKRLEVLTDRFMKRGAHMTEWRTGKYESGTYACHFRYRDYDQKVPILI